MPLEETIEVTVTVPPPEVGMVGRTYVIEGEVKMFGDIGAPPWVYAEVQKKDWYTPDIIEETNYERGFPMPVSGSFEIKWTPKKAGIYDVTVLATPAPLSLPVVGVPPVLGSSGLMKVTVEEAIESGLQIASCSFA